MTYRLTATAPALFALSLVFLLPATAGAHSAADDLTMKYGNPDLSPAPPQPPAPHGMKVPGFTPPADSSDSGQSTTGSQGPRVKAAPPGDVQSAPLDNADTSSPKEELRQGASDAEKAAEARKADAAINAGLVTGPANVKLGKQANLALPQGYAFLPPKEAGAFLERLGNTVEPDSLLGLILPADGDHDWFIVAEYDDTGFRKDDDADAIDADKILEAMKDGTKDDNEERVAHNLPQMEIVGWVEKPHYDKAAHQLIWCVEVRHLRTPEEVQKEEASGKKPQTAVNYNTFTLGRGGDLSLNLVASRATIDNDKLAVAELLKGVTFNKGKRYEDFNAKTDKIAEYGLLGLIGIGVAKQVGLFGLIALGAAKFGKALMLAAVGIVAAIKKFIRKKHDNTV